MMAGGMPSAAHSAVTSDGNSLMYAAQMLPSLGPAPLQPMPRFMGAGPVANGNLLRSRVSSVEPSQYLGAGTV